MFKLLTQLKQENYEKIRYHIYSSPSECYFFKARDSSVSEQQVDRIVG